MVQNVQCPVCTLYLHAGMSLTDHLETHPKEQVIKALVQFTISKSDGDSTDSAVKEENDKKSKTVEDIIDSANVATALDYAGNYESSTKLLKQSLADNIVITTTTTTATTSSTTTTTTVAATSATTTHPYQTLDTSYNRSFIQQQQQQEQQSINTFAHEHSQLQEEQTLQQHIVKGDYAQKAQHAFPSTSTPPPPPPPSATGTSTITTTISSSPTMQHAYTNMQHQQQNHHQHSLIAHHQLQQQQQQQQQQNIKILPWSIMPMQPPLQQLISYQAAAAHATPPHQKPPPAYVTAISQIRSQHNNQNKHNMQQQQHAPTQQQIRQITTTTIATNNLKQIPMYTHQQQSIMLQPSAASSASPTPQAAATTTTTTASNTDVAHCQEQQMLPHYTHGSAQQSQNKHENNQQQQQNQQYNAFNYKVPSQHNSTPPLPTTSCCVETTTIPTTTINKHFPTPTRPLSRPQSAYTPTLRQTNSPYPLTTPSPAPSVLRYAESPVAHYLERDNGDFIVQETPKHIVECVETDDGEFAVTERIYQSPPSVLQMNFDDDVDNDNADIVAEEEEEEEERAEKDDNNKKKEAVHLDEHEKELNITKENSDKEMKAITARNQLEDVDEFLNNNGNATDSDETDENQLKCTNLTKQQIKNKIIKNMKDEIPTTSCNYNNNTTTQNTKSKRSAKNSITVLSDVQLNLNEYLDLMGNIIASSKITGNKAFCNSMQLRRIKLEKEEPYDDEYEQQQIDQDTTTTTRTTTAISEIINETKEPLLSTIIQQQIDEMALEAAATTTTTTVTIPPKRIRNNKYSNNNNIKNHKHINKTDENIKENLSKYDCNELETTKTEHIVVDEEEEKKLNIQVLEECKENYAETSVIRMATTSQKQQQQQQQQQQNITTEVAEKCIAEDLSHTKQENLVEQELEELKIPPSTTTTILPTITTSAATNLHKKGPKKLIIKPKSIKTEQTKHTKISTTTTTETKLDDEKPTTSAAAVAQLHKLQQQIVETTTATATIVLETVVKHENTNECKENNNNNNNVEECKEMVNMLMECKPEEPKLQQEYIQYTDLKLEKERSVATTEDARMLYEFAHSKKHKAAAAAAQHQLATTTTTATETSSFLSSISIFSKINNNTNNNERHHTRSPANDSLRCEDEYMPLDVNETDANQASLSYVTSAQEANDVAQTDAATATNTFLQQQQQQQHHTFADYPFSFLYGANTHAQTHTNDEISRFGNFSPALYHQQQTNDGGGTTAATLASGSNSLAASLDDSSSTHHHQQQQQHQQQHQQQQEQHNFSSTHWYQQQTVANADFETSLAVDCNNAVVSLPDTEGNKYLDLDGFCKRESSSSFTAGTQAIVVASSTTSSSFAAATESSLAGGDALNIRTDEKMPAKGEISEQESNCDIENSWSQPMYGDFPGRFFKTSFPSIFQHDNGWHQDEYFTVQDLSAATNNINVNNNNTNNNNNSNNKTQQKRYTK